ncbi:hypothetical protein SAMN06264365_110300 [Actinoplanes regularis]|uniref:Uncharacterized protein n=1 Tax=Actinoplanes regularis TaxID=52697 RepID=A0A239C544_9ACTN|nr:hypothetical protein Are01nite_45960 [Actinoplanes regularis]SNS15039.1 hypothetical protein SAMN06264365_110300 [Actinoplanes regularis]
MESDGESGSGGTAAFPVVASVTLRPLPARLFRRRSREPGDIPRRPDTMLVAQFEDAYEVVPRGVALTDRLLVDASVLMLVSTAQRLVRVTVMLPSADPRTAIEVAANFRCRVLDPLVLLQQGGSDVRPLLEEYLLRYSRVRMTCLAMSLSDRFQWYRFQQQVVAMLIAYGEVVPVHVPGLTAVLADVVVSIRPVERPGLSVPPPPPGHAPPEPEEPDPVPLRGLSHTFQPDNYTWESR